jgi:hypothetical protein
MKSESSISVVFPDVVPVVRRSAVTALFTCSLFMSAPSLADNVVRFSGSVVNATCSIQPVGANVQGDGQRLTLAPGVTFEVDAAHNACDGQAAPFIARYTPVPQAAPQPSRSDKAADSGGAGVVILTYQ